jgi:glycosyltransferase involved in cell wall biosynthesis
MISVITTVYNGQKFLKETAYSVFSQIYTNWEMVLLDDGSSDGTWDVCKQLAQYDSRVKTIRSTRIGRGNALNKAISHSRGSLLLILDADDILHPQHLSLGRSFLGGQTMNILLSATPIVFDGPSPKWPELNQPGETDVTKALSLLNPMCHSGLLYSRLLYEKTGGYLARPGALDYRFYVDAAAAGAKLIRMNRMTVAKRIHVGQNFERRRRTQYLWWGLRAQVDAIRTLSAPKHHYAVALLRFAYGMLPRQIRLSRHIDA